MSQTIVTVPCFNEATRLPKDEFVRLIRDEPGIDILFVNDGSTDDTVAVLEVLRGCAAPRIDALSLEKNSGKAEAVRRGLLASLERGADIVGYTDADLATPVDEVIRLVREIDRTSAAVVMGSRVALLGTDIQRGPTRHYLGRVFATVASLFLGMRVYDTQCGAKFFRRTAALEAALASPFRSRWAFDVELIGRLITGSGVARPISPAEFVEVPLRSWRDVRGSKLNGKAMLKAGLDLVVVGTEVALNSARRGRGSGG